MKKVEDVLKSLKKNLKNKKELEYFLIHQNRYRFVLGIIVNQLPKKSKILDVGCYPPQLFYSLKKLGYEVFGIASLHEKVKVKNSVNLNIETDKLPFANNFFDLILFSEIIEHLTVNPLIYLEKLKSCLKPKAAILITTANAVSLKNRLKVLFGENIYFPLFQLYDTFPDGMSIYWRHNREYTLQELETIILKAGLKIKTAGYFNSYNPLRKKLYPDRFFVKIIKATGYALSQTAGSLKDCLYLEAVKSS